MLDRAVDIIIPIYNAYNDLQLCIESLMKHTDLKKNTLVLINDKSPDERIKPYLDSLAGEHIIVIHNEENKGFSGNINIGMAISDNDVLFLNSDTVVTANWIEKIVTCAYSDDRIATVTPLSNNATLCSVPNFCEENKLPEGMTVDEMAALVEQCSMNLYPEIPVAHGFCMFVKRTVIEDIGNFDAATFERGYGEENDFCYRAIHAGYINVMCDNTFILHTGTSSFVSDEKMRYIEAHTKILLQRYPTEMQNTHLHCINNPNSAVFDNIKTHLKLRQNKKNILYLLKSDFKEGASDNLGGVQLHVKDMTLGIRDEYNVFVIARDGAYMNLTIYTQDDEISFRYQIGLPEPYPIFTDKKIRTLFENILDAYQIQRVHVHHVATWTLDLFYVAKDRNIPLFTTIHDFYFACPNITLLDSNNKVCHGKENKASCERCLSRNLNLTDKVDYIKIWRKRHLDALKCAAKLIAPSQSVKNIFSSYYPELQDNIIVIEHGSDALQTAPSVNASVIVAGDIRLYIDCVLVNEHGLLSFKGWIYEDNVNMDNCSIWIEVTDVDRNIIRHKAHTESRYDVAQGDPNKVKSGISTNFPIGEMVKGNLEVRVLIENEDGEFKTNGNYTTINYIPTEPKKNQFNVAFIGGLNVTKGAEQAYQLIKKSSKDINWYVIGNIGHEGLYNLKQRNLVKTGGYSRENLNELLVGCKIDLVCILSICPETFCYTLSEALLNKVPVLVTDIGALGERVKDMGAGWLVSPTADADEIYAEVQRIRNNPTEYQKVKEHISTMSLRSVSDMVADYKALYPTVSRADSDIDYTALSKAQKALILPANELSNEEYTHLTDSQQELAILETSLSMRLVKKMASARFPGKQALKRLIMKLHH